MMNEPIDRRRFLYQAAAGVGALSAGLSAGCNENEPAPKPAGAQQQPVVLDEEPAGPRLPYKGPNVILVRFGGGVRRRETIDYPDKTFCPFVYKLGLEQGVLFKNVEIESGEGIETSHGQGTLYLLTGKYDHYEDITHKPFADRFEAKIPTIFEYFRKRYDIPEHQALIVNGEDRINEEFYTFSNHHLFGVRYRSTVLSLYRFKTYLLREDLKNRSMPDSERQQKEKVLQEMENQDYRVADTKVVSPELNHFWAGWREYYGSSGLVNPRGDRLLTTLAIRALKELRPKLMMINYQDTDYVHWGNPHFYTRAVSIIDDGIREIYESVRGDDEYRDNTVFVVVPDCGRDNNRCMAVPFQHHFNSKSAHQVFAVLAGPGIDQPGVAVDKRHQQISVAGTVGKLMNFPAPHVEGGCLEEALA